MSKKQLLKDNLLVFIGANIANALNYLLNILLKRVDDHLFNLYTTYTSISLILLVPSLVAMRTFTVYGESALGNLIHSLKSKKDKILVYLIIFALLLLPLNYFLTKITEEGTWITSFLLIFLSLIAFVANIFRGIKQNDENYRIAILSINFEAVGRLVLGFLFSVILDMGISGILVGHVLGLAASLLICFDRKFLGETTSKNEDLSLRHAFITSTVMTLGLEFISNFDIIYSNYILQAQDTAQTEFNTLQFFRKIIFFGIFAVSSVILSFGSKNKHTKLFSFFFTFFTGVIIGVCLGGFFFVIRGLIFALLKQEITLVDNYTQIIFLVATTMMSTSYLLSNWLFTLKKRAFVYLPIFVSAIQILVFFFLGRDLNSLLNSFLITSVIFFIITVCSSLVEVIQDRKNSISSNDTYA